MTSSTILATARTLAVLGLVGALSACTTAAPGGESYALAQKPAAKDNCKEADARRKGLRQANTVADIPVGVGGLMRDLGVDLGPAARVANVGWRAKSATNNAQRINRGTAALGGC